MNLSMRLASLFVVAVLAAPEVGAVTPAASAPAGFVGPWAASAPAGSIGPWASAPAGFVGPWAASAPVGSHGREAASAPAGRYRWPLDGVPEVVRRFDPPARRWLAGHRGVDLVAAPGAVVRAAGPGVVFHVGVIAGRGVVSIAHPGGLRTTYEPVDAAPELRAGSPVAAGTVLGALAAGHRGCPRAACLHWGLRHGPRYLDPLSLLGLGRVRLLPLRGGEGRQQRG